MIRRATIAGFLSLVGSGLGLLPYLLIVAISHWFLGKHGTAYQLVISGSLFAFTGTRIATSAMEVITSDVMLRKGAVERLTLLGFAGLLWLFSLIVFVLVKVMPVGSIDAQAQCVMAYILIPVAVIYSSACRSLQAYREARKESFI
jgi:hypothetical protein